MLFLFSLILNLVVYTLISTIIIYLGGKRVKLDDVKFVSMFFLVFGSIMVSIMISFPLAAMVTDNGAIMLLAGFFLSAFITAYGLCKHFWANLGEALALTLIGNGVSIAYLLIIGVWLTELSFGYSFSQGH